MPKNKAMTYAIGRGKPPKATQWRKGQCGNPRRIRRPRAASIAELIDRAFARKITVWQNGVPIRMTVFQAIVLQLWVKAAKGSSRALRILRRYEKFADSRARGSAGNQQVEIMFADE